MTVTVVNLSHGQVSRIEFRGLDMRWVAFILIEWVGILGVVFVPYFELEPDCNLPSIPPACAQVVRSGAAAQTQS